MNLPNKITISRIVLILLMIVAMFVLAFIPNLANSSNNFLQLGDSGINLIYLVFCVVFIVAAVTDFLDGYLARKLNQVTSFGKFLDPIADKLLNNATMIFLLVPQAYAASTQRSEPMMLTILMICVIFMIARDLTVDAMRMIAVQKGKVVAANMFGKAKTVLQMIAIPMLLLNDWPFRFIYGNDWPQALGISNLFFYAATLMSIISGVIYIIQNKEVFKDTK